MLTLTWAIRIMQGKEEHDFCFILLYTLLLLRKQNFNGKLRLLSKEGMMYLSGGPIPFTELIKP